MLPVLMYNLKMCGTEVVDDTEIPVMLVEADGNTRIDSIEYQLYKSESGTKHLYVEIGDDAFVVEPESSKKFLDQAIECGRIILRCQYINHKISNTVELPPDTIKWFKKMRNLMRFGGDGGGGTSAAD